MIHFSHSIRLPDITYLAGESTLFLIWSSAEVSQLLLECCKRGLSCPEAFSVGYPEGPGNGGASPCSVLHMGAASSYNGLSLGSPNNSSSGFNKVCCPSVCTIVAHVIHVPLILWNNIGQSARQEKIEPPVHAIIFYRAERNAWTTFKNFVILNRSRWDARYGDTLSFIATLPGCAGAL